MATSWGILPDAQGNGTTHSDIQRIIAALFINAGIVDGCAVSTNSTMNYTVRAGAVVMNTGTDQMILTPVPATTISTEPGPATGTRTDKVYVRQLMPETDNSSNVVVAVTSGALPANSIELARFVVPAGATSTDKLTNTLDRSFARMVTSPTGNLISVSDSNTAVHQGEAYQWGQGRFTVPTDRNLDVRISSTVVRTSKDGAALNGSLRAALRHDLYIDNVKVKSAVQEFSGVFADTYQFETQEAVGAGSHTVHVISQRVYLQDGIYAPNDYWAVRTGGALKYHGSHVTVSDAGTRV